MRVINEPKAVGFEASHMSEQQAEQALAEAREENERLRVQLARAIKAQAAAEAQALYWLRRHDVTVKMWELTPARIESWLRANGWTQDQNDPRRWTRGLRSVDTTAPPVKTIARIESMTDVVRVEALLNAMVEPAYPVDYDALMRDGPVRVLDDG